MIFDRHFLMNKKMHPGSILLFSVMLSFPVMGQTGTGENLSDDMRGDQVELDPLVVVASKSPRPLSEIAAQVTVIDAADIRVGMAEDVDGMLKYEPGLEMETAGTRFGATSINIRGIGGNRVAVEIDGIPVRDGFVIGAFSNGGRALVEPDRIKRVEVLHGPASVMYGSDAVGGVVAISTWDPSDLLTGSGNSGWLGLRGGYQGINDSWVGSGVAAWGEGAHGFLAAATYREGHELENQAPADIPKDPQDWDSTDYMFRYTYDTSAGNRFRISAERTERKVRSEMNSQLGYGRRFRNTTELLGDDRDKSRRLSADYEFSFGGWQQGVVRGFNVVHETDQLTLEERASAVNPVKLERRFFYEQDLSGVELNLSREEQWGSSTHRIGLGAEWLRTDITEMRDGLQTSLIDGSSTNIILGEEMPVRDFPISRTGDTGLFIQDEIALADGLWEIIPALRWDRYKLDPRPDSIWLEDNPDTEVVAVRENQFTPRLGVLFHAGDAWTIYGQYSRGFRAPPFADANIGFDIPLFGFRAIPNPDLKSETSNGYELGLRRLAGGSLFSLAGFLTDYEDFIESRVLIGRDPETGDLIFQSRNIDQARIYGFDIRYDQDLGEWNESLRGWMLNAAAYWAKGENRDSGQPLNSIAPPQAVIGLSWVAANDSWDFAATGTFTSSKGAGDIDETDGERFVTPSWAIVDLTAGWRPNQRIELRAGIFNATDKKYWRWLDVANMDSSDPMIILLSRPGRSFSVTARLSF
jgi:hemoglobin/transferrin/lactoferrin receptor protein